MSKNKAGDLPLLEGVPIVQPNNDFERENNWLIEIIEVACENGFTEDSIYQQKIELLKSSSIYHLSRYDLFWLADQFARVFGRLKYRCDYFYYHTLFFKIFFGKEPKKAPNTNYWAAATRFRLEKKALQKPNPSQTIVFNSGASSFNDAWGYMLANKAIGVQIGLCSEAVIGLLLEYNSRGGYMLADSGAFSSFRKGTKVDFDNVFKAYFDLVGKAEKPELLSLIACDVIGDQGASLALLKQYRKELYKLICLGVDLIVPLQLGSLSLAEAYKEAVSIIGIKAFRVGFPSNERAVPIQSILEFISVIEPKSLHFLGLGSTKVKSLVEQIKAISPNTHISCDATSLRSQLKKGSNLVRLIETKTKKAVHESLTLGIGFMSYNDLVNKIFHQPTFLSKNQARELAKLITPVEYKQDSIVHAALNEISGFHNGSRLGDHFDKFYEKGVIDQALQQFAQALARRAVSGKQRAAAIAEVQISTPLSA